jgi:anthranilate phosphoribosyltransferase
VRRALDGGEDGGAARDIVLLNAGAAIYVAGLVSSIADGVDAARRAIDSGAARERLTRLAELSQTLGGAADA